MKSRQTAVSGLYEISSSVPRRKNLLAKKLQSKQRNETETHIHIPRDMTSPREPTKEEIS